MSASLNKATIIGNVGNAPEVKELAGGTKVASFSIATTERWKDKTTGEAKEATEWHRVSAFGKLADIIGQYVQKGTHVYVEGKLRTSKYQKDGQDHYSTEIVINELKLLGTKQAGSTAPTDASADGAPNF